MNDEKLAIQKQIEEELKDGSGPKVVKYALACLSGIIPLAGGASRGGLAVLGQRQNKKNLINY